MAAPVDHFRVARFVFTIRARETLRLPAYKGSTLRGGFGHVFRRVGCIARQGECPPCRLGGRCPYVYIFETPPPGDTEILRKYPAAPHPFVIEPPPDAATIYDPGSTLDVGIVLIGRAIDYLPYFIYAFDELGRVGIGRGKGRYDLTEVRGESRDGRQNGWTRIYGGEERLLRDDFRIRTAAELTNTHPHDHDHEHDHAHEIPDRLNIHFLTPTRLKFDNGLTSDLEFHILIRNLLRRVSLLSYFHCGHRLDLDFRGVIQRAKGIATEEKHLRWVDWERYSARQGTTMLMGGLVGSATFAGQLGEFLPLLRLGEWIHVGKGTVMGLGLYGLTVPGSA